MKVTRLSAIHYRNLKELEIYPQEGVNIIYGENAHGKKQTCWRASGCLPVAVAFAGCKRCRADIAEK